MVQDGGIKMGVAIYKMNDIKRIRNMRYKDTSFKKVHNAIVIGGGDSQYSTLFDGDGDYGSIPYNTLLSWTGSGKIEAEVRCAKVVTSDNYVVSKGNDSDICGWGLYIRVLPDYAEVACVINDVYYKAGFSLNTADKWIKFGCVFIKDASINLYVNDELKATTAVCAGSLRYANDSRIGEIPSSNISYFKGAIRNIKFYNGNTLVNHYPMDDDPSTGIFRDIINGINATRYGNPTRTKFEAISKRLNV